MRAAAGLACAGLRRHVAKKLCSVLNALEKDLCGEKQTLLSHYLLASVLQPLAFCGIVLFRLELS